MVTIDYILEVDVNTAKTRPVDKPESDHILVSLDRLRRCPEEIGDSFWPARSPRHSRKKKQRKSGDAPLLTNDVEDDPTNSVPETMNQTEVEDISVPPTVITNDATMCITTQEISDGSDHNNEGSVSSQTAALNSDKEVESQ